jgi:cytochrome b561
MKNSPARYGFVTKLLHWTLFLLILNQFVVAAAMLSTQPEGTWAGFTPGGLYNWHKSIGLVALAAAIVRYIWRQRTPLPDWAPNLNDREKRAIHWIERPCTLHVSDADQRYIFVMAVGGYGVLFFGL